jgi:uncharacterized DUF497 family protein
MAEDDIVIQRLFERIRAVEWNEAKAANNRGKHGIDFDEAVEIFYGTSLLRRSYRNTEERWLAIGETEGRVIAVVFTWRGDALRIISARPARRNEKRAYNQKKMGRPAQGQD